MVLGCLVCQLGLGYGYIYSPLAGDILAEFGWTRAMFSSARGPQLFAIAVASPLVGAATVRFGARPVLMLSALLVGLTLWLLSSIQNLWQLYGVNILLGLMMAGLGDIPVGAVASQWVHRGRGLALGVIYSGSNLGGMILAPTVVLLAQASSWRNALWLVGLIGMLLVLPCAAWLVREPTGREASTRRAEASAADNAGSRDDLDLARALRTRSFWILAAALFCFFFYFVAMIDHLVLFLTDVGMSQLEAAGTFGFAIGLGIVGKLGFGLIADRISHRTALLLDFGLLAVSSLLLLAVPQAGLLPVFLVSYGISVAARDVVYPLVVADCFGTRYMAQIYGGLMLALLPGGALGPIFAGAVHDLTGSYDAAFATFAILNVLAFVALRRVRTEGAPTTPEEQP